MQPSSSRRPGRPQEADFPAMVGEVVANLEPKIEQKLQQKQHKNHRFFYHLLDLEKYRNYPPKPLQNGAQDGPKSTSEGSRSEKQQKCKNDQPSNVFGTFSVSAGVENPTNFFKKWCRKRVENQVRF